MILRDRDIRTLGIVSPCEPRTKHRGMSYGLSMAGYDVTCEVITPMDGYRDTMLVDGSSGIQLKPGQGVLLGVREHFTMPSDVVGFVKDKSTWARQGLVTAQAVIEPGWRGHLSVWVTNNSDDMLSIIDGDPIAQVVFLQMTGEPENLYAGKYQDQGRGPQGPRHE